MMLALAAIEKELEEQIAYFNENNLLIEAQRIEQRTRYDIEMLREIGFCQGIENYSRHISGRKKGSAPYTLIDYFPDDFLLIVDESHVTLPQVRGMYNGDRARKESLVRYGFRLPCAFDNRPLTFEEFEKKLNQPVRKKRVASNRMTRNVDNQNIQLHHILLGMEISANILLFCQIPICPF